MKTIRIIAGTFGWNHGNYDLVRAGDPPIEVDTDLAKRLVEKGVAEYVTPIRQEAPDAEPDMENMSAKELRELGKQYGLTFPAKCSKAEMLGAIQEELQGAPEFDATEAVQ